jgi:hypothetical protein
MRGLAARYGTGRMSIVRHRKEHLPELLALGYAAEEASRADDLLADIARIRESAFDLLDKAERSSPAEWRARVAAIREVRENVRLLAELRGKLASRTPSGPGDLTAHPQWIAVRTVLISALDPYPIARKAVSAALSEATEASNNGRH